MNHHARILVLAALCAVFVSASAPKKPPKPSQTLFFRQQLDHFQFDSNASFSQKVLTYDEHWKSPRGPLLVYFGNEGAIEDFWDNTGFMFELAPLFGARIVFLEHRYYGSSLPFGDSSYETKKLAYLTIEQALADMAVFLSAKQSFLGASEASRAVLFGGSYGGMLSAWFMLKYPQLAAGALAASAPVDIYPGEGKQRAFFDAGMYVYGKYGSAQCESWIRTALQRASLLGTTEGGRSLLSSQLNTCSALGSDLDSERVLMYVNGALSTMAMVDYPYATTFVTPMPANPVSFACNHTISLSPDSSDELLMQGLSTVINVFVNFTGQIPCHNTSKELLATTPRTFSSSSSKSRSFVHNKGLGDITRPWNYQACAELILEPLTSNGDGFFVETASQIEQVEAACQNLFPGMLVRPHWMEQSFGNGEQLVKATHNIIFSDGEKDPWRVGGVPSNASLIGDGSVVHIFIKDGAHHQDLRFSDPRNPPTVDEAKKRETALIADWLGLDY